MTLASKDFFLLYALCVLTYTKISVGAHRTLGIVVTIALNAVPCFTFGTAQLCYAMAPSCWMGAGRTPKSTPSGALSQTATAQALTRMTEVRRNAGLSRAGARGSWPVDLQVD